MNKWMKRLLVVFQIGGGFAGLVVGAQYLFMSDASVTSVIICLIFSTIFVFGIVTGLVLIENERVGILLSQIFMGIQIPLLSSPIIEYKLISGLGVVVFFQAAKVGLNSWLGCHYTFYLFREAPWGIGMNLVALMFFIYLARLRKSKTERDATKDHAEAESQSSDVNPRNAERA
jgi:hypothetical protein